MPAGNRILITTDAVGGVWQYATDLARALRPLGYQPLLALLGPAPSDAQRSDAADLQLIDTGLPLDWLCDNPAPVLAAGEAIARLAADQHAELVHLNMPSLAATARFPAPVIAAAHGCVGTWWHAANGTKPDASYAWADALTREGFHAADAVIAPSASYAATVQRHHGLADRPHVVHNGRAPLPSIAADPADHVFTAGRLWDRVKNTTLLDQVAGRLPVPFRAAGSVAGPHGERIATEHLTLLGQLGPAELASELATQPIFVSAASFEPFGLAVLEAASAGCPLVLSGIDTFRELWTGAALFSESEDADSYLHAIARIRDDAALRAHLSDAALLRARRYTPDAMAIGTATIYANLLGVGTRAAA